MSQAEWKHLWKTTYYLLYFIGVLSTLCFPFKEIKSYNDQQKNSIKQTCDQRGKILHNNIWQEGKYLFDISWSGDLERNRSVWPTSLFWLRTCSIREGRAGLSPMAPSRCLFTDTGRSSEFSYLPQSQVWVEVYLLYNIWNIYSLCLGMLLCYVLYNMLCVK